MTSPCALRSFQKRCGLFAETINPRGRLQPASECVLKRLLHKEKLCEANRRKLQNVDGNYWQFSTEGIPDPCFCQVQLCILGFL